MGPIVDLTGLSLRSNCYDLLGMPLELQVWLHGQNSAVILQHHYRPELNVGGFVSYRFCPLPVTRV